MNIQDEEKLKSVLRTLTELLYDLKRKDESVKDSDLLKGAEESLIRVIESLFQQDV